jgi:hypothetical protein
MHTGHDETDHVTHELLLPFILALSISSLVKIDSGWLVFFILFAC